MTQLDDGAETILVRINGPDHPGITAGLMELLASAGAGILDVEQIIISGRLALSLAITVPAGHDLIKDVLLFGWQQKIDVDFEVVTEAPNSRSPGLVITIVGAQVPPDEFGAVARIIASHDGNIDRIFRLARYPVMAYELVMSGGNHDAIRHELLTAAHDLECDVAVHREGLGRQAARLVVLDVDSTLIQDEMVELVADEAGCRAEVEALTAAAMAGDMDFGRSLKERVELLAGLDAAALDRAFERIRLTPGARTFVRTLRRLGFRTAIVSGGFTSITNRLAEQLGVDHAFANTLEITDGRLTGHVTGPIVDRKGKEALLRRVAELEGVPLDQVVAVGDGANDVDMLNAAGLGIAFNAKPIVRHAADASLNVPYLDAILFVLGVRREAIELADAE